eukprot:scaffold210585_cov19-Tisochrysis_lutea.AAC.2
MKQESYSTNGARTQTRRERGLEQGGRHGAIKHWDFKKHALMIRVGQFPLLIRIYTYHTANVWNFQH